MSAVYACALLQQAAGRLWLTGATLGGVLVVEIALLAALIPRLGIMGAPYGLTISAAAGLAVLLPTTLRTWRIGVGVGPALRYAAALAVLALVLRLCPESAGRLMTVGWIVVAGACYLGLLVGTRLLRFADVAVLLGGLSPRLAARLTGSSGPAGRG
jgi:hypothetical protein